MLADMLADMLAEVERLKAEFNAELKAENFCDDRFPKGFVVPRAPCQREGCDGNGVIYLQRSNKGSLESSRQGTHDRTINPNASKKNCGYMTLHP